MRTSASVHTFSIFHHVGFFLYLVSKLVALLPELGGKVESLERDLETEWSALASDPKARSEADQEVLALRGWVMGTEEATARLGEQVT